MKKIIAVILPINIKLISSILIFSILLNGFLPKIKISENIKETAIQIIENNKEAITFTVSMLSPVKSTNQIIRAVTSNQKEAAKAASPAKEKNKKDSQQQREENSTISENSKINKSSRLDKKKNKISKWEILNFCWNNKKENEASNNIEIKISAGINKEKACCFSLARSSLGSEGSIIKLIIIKR